MPLSINLVLPASLLVLLDRIADAQELQAIQVKRIADALTVPPEDVSALAEQIEAATDALHASQESLTDSIESNTP